MNCILPTRPSDQMCFQLEDTQLQVTNALDFALLTRRLQEERLSVALNFFIRSGKLFTCSIY